LVHVPNGTSLRDFSNPRNGHLLRAEQAKISRYSRPITCRYDSRIARLPLPSVIAFLRKASVNRSPYSLFPLEIMRRFACARPAGSEAAKMAAVRIVSTGDWERTATNLRLLPERQVITLKEVAFGSCKKKPPRRTAYPD